jgi:hypothetical protein
VLRGQKIDAAEMRFALGEKETMHLLKGCLFFICSGLCV